MEEKFLHAEGPGAEKNSRFQTRNRSNSHSRAASFSTFELARLQGRNTFSNGERLKSDKIIEQLFKEGKAVKQNGFALIYLYAPLNVMYPAQAGFTVPKRNFKSALDRNRIKRLMREAYRLRKFELYQKLVERKQQLAMMWVYNGKQIPDYTQAEKAISACIDKLLN